MASDDESGDVEEAVAFELEASRNVQKYRPIALEDLLKQTKFTRQEIRVMYRGFKQVSSFYNIQNVFFFFVEEQKFSEIFTENSTKLFFTEQASVNRENSFHLTPKSSHHVCIRAGDIEINDLTNLQYLVSRYLRHNIYPLMG